MTAARFPASHKMLVNAAGHRSLFSYTDPLNGVVQWRIAVDGALLVVQNQDSVVLQGINPDCWTMTYRGRHAGLHERSRVTDFVSRAMKASTSARAVLVHGATRTPWWKPPLAYGYTLRIEEQARRLLADTQGASLDAPERRRHRRKPSSRVDGASAMGVK